MGVRGCHPRENFEIWDAIWCNLLHFGKKFTFLQLSTFVNEYIVIVVDSGIDIVTYNFNFLVVCVPSVWSCSRRLACSRRVSCRQNMYSPWRGEVNGPSPGESKVVSGESSPPLRGGWINPWTDVQHSTVARHCMLILAPLQCAVHVLRVTPHWLIDWAWFYVCANTI